MTILLSIIAGWCIISVPVGFVAAHALRNRGPATLTKVPMPIDLATLAPVDRINIPPGRYVSSAPLDVLVGSQALHVEAGGYLFVPDSAVA